MTKEDKQIIDRAVKEEWRIGDRTRLRRLLEKNLEQYRENVELEQQVEDLELTNSKLKEQLSLRYNLEDKIALLEQQIEKMKCCGNCKSFKGYGETCEGWGEPVLNLNCDCTEWELKEIEK